MLENRLRFLGIFNIRSPTSLTHSLINITYRAFVLSILLFLFMSSGWFMLFEAKTYDEFTQIASVMAGAVVGLAVHISFLCDKLNIIQIMNDLNELVRKSKWKLCRDWKYSIKFVIVAIISLKFRNWKSFDLWRSYQKSWKAVSNIHNGPCNSTLAHVFAPKSDDIVLSIFHIRKKQRDTSAPRTCIVSFRNIHFIIK